jgi:hypothetical protein
VRCTCAATPDGGGVRYERDDTCATETALGLRQPCAVGQLEAYLADPRGEYPPTAALRLGSWVEEVILARHREIREERGVETEILTRSQHSRGSSSHRFGGPDRYVVVVERPVGLPEWGTRPLHEDRARLRGYVIHRCGEGYARSTGPRSMLGRAWAEAEELTGTILQEATARTQRRAS